MKHPLSKADKEQLRQHIKNQRRKLDSNTQTSAAQQVHNQLCQLPIYQNSHHIALYWAVHGELDTKDLLNSADTQKKFYLPIIGQSNQEPLLFALYRGEKNLQANRYSIPEPIYTQDALLSADSLDLICLPLVAFDQARNRMGMGAGYYDRTLALRKRQTTPYCIGLAYEFQKIDTLTPETWDIPMDCIITEQKIYF